MKYSDMTPLGLVSLMTLYLSFKNPYSISNSFPPAHDYISDPKDEINLYFLNHIDFPQSLLTMPSLKWIVSHVSKSHYFPPNTYNYHLWQLNKNKRILMALRWEAEDSQRRVEIFLFFLTYSLWVWHQ